MHCIRRGEADCQCAVVLMRNAQCDECVRQSMTTTICFINLLKEASQWIVVSLEIRRFM